MIPRVELIQMALRGCEATAAKFRKELGGRGRRVVSEAESKRRAEGQRRRWRKAREGK